MHRRPVPHVLVLLGLLGAFVAGAIASSAAVELTAASRQPRPAVPKRAPAARVARTRKPPAPTKQQLAAQAKRRADEARRKAAVTARRAVEAKRAAAAARERAILARVSRHGLSWPRVDLITSDFGWRHAGFHHGIDILCNPKGGEPIRASNGGRVVAAGVMPVYGRAVIIQHPNNMRTLYGHMSSLAVRIGSNVRRGQVIGRCGSSGNSTAPHLHFEVYSWGRIINPLAVLPSK